MRSFNDYLFEATMRLDTALKVFNINSVPTTKIELNAIYKKLAMANHPDRGGSTEKMSAINNAKEVLEKNLGKRVIGSGKVTDFEYDEEYILKHESVFNMCVNFCKSIDLNKYCNYFTDKFKEPFTYEILKLNTQMTFDKKHPFTMNTGINVMFKNADRSTVFTLHIWFDNIKIYSDIYGGKVIKLTNDISTIKHSYTYNATAVVKGKTQVIVKARYNTSESSAILTDPSFIFSEKKIEKYASGTGGRTKETKAKKSDFEALFKTKYSGIILGNGGTNVDYAVPIGDEIYLIFIRRTMNRQAMYEFGEIAVKERYTFKKLIDVNNVLYNKLHWLVGFEDNLSLEMFDEYIKFAKSHNMKHKEIADKAVTLMKKYLEKTGYNKN